MGTILVLIMATFGTNPQMFDTPTIHVDGYIELNHYWSINDSQSGRSILNKNGNFIYVPFGYCVFDQMLVRKYNHEKDRFEIVHQLIIRDGRLKHQLKGEALEKHRNKMIQEWEFAHRAAVKDLNCGLEDVVVYHDSPYVGAKGVNAVSFNQNTKLYEVYMKANPGRYFDEKETDINKNYDIGTYKFTAQRYYETNTLYDPESEDSSRRNVGIGTLRFKGYETLFKKMIRIKRGLPLVIEEPPVPEIEFPED